ncbi:transglutaminase [Haematobacter massiliensis]|uniref:Transglutaminase n=1 Tax=Haematobacter massiliensis TaxID=195105 RepID=A0A086XYN1_9RHOB|nr:transglutaminase family protein [Haematobacter massiliensis]KFI27131.1 transglutaminase [Haematobacter massiliensis]OWJ73801.1 transglutaminase [Haematobacter massiliensis]OWJ82439.1 transglutaminase [Haematobacter massiliensis]QBJ23644.1 transglutaminase family protein [Haematobacter massiliensis]
MRYELKMSLDYIYEGGAEAGRHLLRIVPLQLAGEQRVEESRVTVDPSPAEWHERTDFFGNRVIELAFDGLVEETCFRLEARVERLPQGALFDVSPRLADIAREVMEHRDLGPESPHHFLGPSARVPRAAALIGYGHGLALPDPTVWETVVALGQAVHRDMIYDPDATEVDTPVLEAFAARRGVCQDFAHAMIGALRGLGIPAGYVSGFLRTEPPPGAPRLEGADAMHAWVRAWCGHEMGWREYDPTNAMAVGEDHIVIAQGRDYADVSPVRGALRTAGSQSSEQAVDVIPLG